MYSSRMMVLAALLTPVVVLAQGGMMGPGMMGGGGMMAAPSFVDVSPLWSPDGRYIAFWRMAQGQDQNGKGCLADTTAAAAAEPTVVGNSLEPLAWMPDGKGLVCGYHVASGMERYGGFWLVDVADPKKITLLMPGTVAKSAYVSPDKLKLLLVDEINSQEHQLWVGPVDKPGRLVFNARKMDLLQAGWTNDSQSIWVLVKITSKPPLQRGDPLPDDALKPPATGMGGMGMMGGGMMGPGMMGGGGGMMGGGGGMMGGGGGMMGPGMMGGGAASQAKNMLYVIPVDNPELQKIGEDIEAVAWSPTAPLLAVYRKVVKPAAGGGGMMGPGMMGGGGGGGMMGPGMMGGGGGGMMGPGMMGGGAAATEDEYLALRKPTPEDETRVPGSSKTLTRPVWDALGTMIAGACPPTRHILCLNPPSAPLVEVAQNGDDTVAAERALAWSPDGTKIVYAGAIGTKQGEDSYIIRGLFIRELSKAGFVQLTENKSKVAPAGMGGMGSMMGPGMMAH